MQIVQYLLYAWSSFLDLSSRQPFHSFVLAMMELLSFIFIFDLFVSSVLAILGASREGLVESAANNTYDFVVVGCGIAGLVVTMRLSEIPNISVLCIEAGPLYIEHSYSFESYY